MGIAEAVWWWVGGWVEVLVTVSHWAPSGPEKTLGVSFSVKFQGGEFYELIRTRACEKEETELN